VSHTANYQTYSALNALPSLVMQSLLISNKIMKYYVLVLFFRARNIPKYLNN